MVDRDPLFQAKEPKESLCRHENPSLVQVLMIKFVYQTLFERKSMYYMRTHYRKESTYAGFGT